MLFRLCLKLGANKATGLVGILARFIKDSTSIVTGPIAHIINLSMITGIVPDDRITAPVVLLLKKNDNTETDNYRPVSILNIVSKVYERVIYDQFEDYLLQNKLFLNISLVLGEVFLPTLVLLIYRTISVSKWIKAILQEWYFWIYKIDTVDHGVLLMKLELIGLDANGFWWFQLVMDMVLVHHLLM